MSEHDDEEYAEDYLMEADVYTGIIAGLPVLVIDDPRNEGIWVAPANILSYMILTPYMSSWFYNDDSPVFIYEGSYWGGLFDWLTSAKEEK